MARRRDTTADQLTLTETAPAPPAKQTRPPRPVGVDDASALPQLLDRKSLAAQTGLPRSTIDVIFRQCPVVALPGHRKVYVRRADVATYFERHTFRDDRVRPSRTAA